jgi:hypothetical protein
MENILVMHLVTVVTVILILSICVCVPWLIGQAINRMIVGPNKDPIATWLIGAICIPTAMLVGFLIYLVYTDIFNYYTKP